ncbi:hypothetical protein BC332_24835 [Capsicum chinense]|nr:hypothetical protein BC332_24835 [Capsicum chinense]
MDITQLQVDLAAAVRGNDILKCEVQNALDALSCATPKLKYLKLQTISTSSKNIHSQPLTPPHLRIHASSLHMFKPYIPPEICRLRNLQTFIVQGLPGQSVKTITFPEEIWGLMQLRHLKGSKFYLPNPPSVSADKGSHKGFSNIQTTSYLSSLCFTKKVISGIQNVKKLGGKLFDFELHNNLVYLQQIEILSFIYCYRILSPMTSVKAFPATLKKLKLRSTYLSWSYLDIIAELPNLEVLKLIFQVIIAKANVNIEDMAHASVASIMRTIESLLTSNSPMQSLICDHSEDFSAFHGKISFLEWFNIFQWFNKESKVSTVQEFPSSSRNILNVEKSMIGSDDQRKRLVEDLTRSYSSETKVIPIVGMGGIAKVDKVFIGSEAELADMLQKSLKGKRYLIVLDDMWKSEAWDAVRLCFPSENKGSGILLTTRNTEAARDAGTKNLSLQMDLMGPDESWSLFKSVAFSSEELTL